MELIDFLEFEPFIQLRQRMGAELLGEFELIDPAIHLTYDERELLRNNISVEAKSVSALPDNTLQYKNARVIVLGETLYHPANCEVITRVLERAERLLTINSGALDLADRKPCGHCLQRLQIAGFERARQRQRHQAMSNQELVFSVEEFYRRFPAYPVKVERPWAMVLGL